MTTELDQQNATGKGNQPQEIHVLDHKVRLLQPENGFRTSIDSVFLAAACPAGKGSRVLDMGCGVGGAGFCLLWRVQECHVTGVDIQQSHIDLARANIGLNGMEGRAEFVCADIRAYEAGKKFDHVICNPPYLEAGSYTPSSFHERAMALGHTSSFKQFPPSPNPLPAGERAFEEPMTLQHWINAGFENLKSGGSFTIIHRADMCDKIILAMGRKFGAVEIIPLYPKEREDAKRVIVRVLKDRKTPARLSAGIVLHEKDGKPTRASDNILRDGAAIG
jgi:tRNA1(Val) A37 N6-methylase TrmN6